MRQVRAPADGAREVPRRIVDAPHRAREGGTSMSCTGDDCCCGDPEYCRANRPGVFAACRDKECIEPMIREIGARQAIMLELTQQKAIADGEIAERE
jgi:hypothetical protein